MEEEKNFFLSGQNLAKEKMTDLYVALESVKNIFGEKAAEEFEIGFLSTISEYQFTNKDDLEDVDITKLSGTTKFGMPNLRNNSYFGGVGISKQYIVDDSGREIYNEPTIKKR